MKILVINPGSTSTKIAVYENETPVLLRNITHSAEQLAPFGNITEQQDFRRQLVLDELRQADVPLQFDAVIGRGGLVKPLKGGVYEINDLMIKDTLSGIALHNHACNLGCLIAHEIAATIPGCRSFIADPGVVDELNDYARISGSPLMNRICIWHALNQRAIAKRFAREIGRHYNDMNLIICHLGGGISVAAHEKGVAVDAPNALDGEGPFTPERAGTIPAADLVRLCFSGKYTQEELLKQVAGNAGLAAHLGTNDMRAIEDRVNNGDEKAKFMVDAMIYHIAKEIASKGAVLYGKIDAILLTGGIAHWTYVVEEIRKRVSYLAPVFNFPGEDEMQALADNALAVLKGEREAKVFK